jgi:tetraacyldisaccharide-1-P 4'-kinase
VGELRLPDHHHYTLKDATTLSHYLTHTDFIITTAKDWVKMGDQAFKKLPILVVEIVLKIRDESLFRNTLFKHLS